MSDWKNVQYKDGKLRTNNSGSGGASALSDLTDVDLTNIADGQILKWDATNSKWVNANESGGSGHTYSTTEQVVGTWIDEKPLYRRTFVFSASEINNDSMITDIVSSSIDTIMFDLSGTYLRTKDTSDNAIIYKSISYYDPLNNQGVRIDASQQYIKFTQFRSSSSNNVFDGNSAISILYTKTTD